MDPFIERAALWPDFHDSLITEIRRALQPLLRPKYVALTQDRLYVVASRRPIYPDVAVVQPRSLQPGSEAPAAVLETDEPTVFDVENEEIRQPYIEILEPAAGNRLITAIEVLSPDNKAAGVGRKRYMRKKPELRKGGANFVEIDLLRDGKPTFRLPADVVARLPAWRYLVGVSRRPRRREVYAIPLERRLPRIRIPLGEGDADVRLDLQGAFTRVWQDGPYPALLNYDGPPPGELTAPEIAWCTEQLRQAGLR
jgi:hypothetical protein